MARYDKQRDAEQRANRVPARHVRRRNLSEGKRETICHIGQIWNRECHSTDRESTCHVDARMERERDGTKGEKGKDAAGGSKS
jgi:hypothetical protein